MITATPKQHFDARAFGQRLNKAVVKSGFKIKFLAAKLDVAESTLREWRSGIRTPRASDIVNLCMMLDLSADELLGLGRKESDE